MREFIASPTTLARDRPPRVERAETMAGNFTLGDIARLIDGLAESTQASFDRIATKIERLEVRVDRIEMRLDRIETKFDELETRVDEIEAQP